MYKKKMFCQLPALILAVAMCLSMLPASIARAEGAADMERFTDVMPGQWYYSAVEYVVTNGYFNGVSENSFAPDAPMTRAMFVTVLGRFAGVKNTVDASPAFSDVEPGSYYSGYVSWAAENGIVQGISLSVFGQADYVTREQVAVFLYRYAQLIGLDVSVQQTADPTTFNGGGNTSTWALKAMVWALNRGIMLGISNDLNPKADVTRAQVAQIFMNFARYAEQ